MNTAGPITTAATAVQSSKPMLPPDFNKWVRHYVHYDTLTKTFQSQTTNARQMKDQYEEKILEAMEYTNMKNAIIQIAGGKIQLVEETHPAPLTFVNLERLLHDYFTAKGSKFPDETDAILKFIKTNRKMATSAKLKRDMTTPLPPPPPPSLNNL
jgi:hypothetical protein